MILCANPQAGYLARKADIDAALHRVLDKGWYVLGEEVSKFEAEFAAYVGVNHAIGVGSGTEAIHLALAAADVGPGDEVITVSHTAVATVSAIELTGATPVLVDIDPRFYTMDPAALEAAITPKTKAIVAVHLYGQPADMEEIMAIAGRHDVTVIEDCAQCHGATWQGRKTGSIGHIACFSFYPTKNLGALGDGGMVVTGDAHLAGRVKALREYGWTERYISRMSGWNSRLDELQAAVLRVKLPHLDADNAARGRLARIYDEGLRNAPLVLPHRRPGTGHVFHLYVVRGTARNALQARLKEAGIGTIIHYPVPIHLQPAYAGRLAAGGALPHTEKAAEEILSLPLYPELTDEKAHAVVTAVLDALSADA